MTRSEHAYWEDLTIQLRHAGWGGAEIGSILEESQDHLVASGEDPVTAFGSPAAYASELAASGHEPRTGGLDLSRGDLLAAAAQLGAWGVLVAGIFAFGGAETVVLRPGFLAGWVVLTIGFVWPVWPAVRAFTVRRARAVVPVVAMAVVVAASVVLSVRWQDPVLALIAPVPAILAAAATIGGCLWRAWRQRDPILPPITRR